MKKSIVLDLQMLATESNVPIAELLRKALLIASKLQLDVFKKWINCELHGYYNEVDVPDYRKLTAHVSLKNPYRGLIPFIIDDPEISDLISNTEARDPIESLSDLLQNRSNGNYFSVPFSNSQQLTIMKLQGSSYPMEAIRRVSPNQIAGVIDAVRTKILEWTLELESNGILGDGLIFNDVERSRAVKSTSINIQHFQGVLGDMAGGTINQNMVQNISVNDFASLAQCLREKGVGDKDIIELQDAVVLDGSPAANGKFGDKVSAWIGKMLSKSADGSWQIGLAVAGNVLSEALGKYYGF